MADRQKQIPSNPNCNLGVGKKIRSVLAAASLLRCQVLLTGDKSHFGPLYGTRVEGVDVLSPAQGVL
jgi:hypothetical protein